MNIGSTIKDLRKKKGIKQGVFAEMIGVSGTSLSQIEGNITIPKKSTLEKICKELNVSSDLLYLLSIGVENIPEHNRVKFETMFPQVRELMIQIFSEDGDKLLTD